jgi:galactofuranose transport system permease protein
MKINQRYIPVFATIFVFCLLYAVAGITFPGFFSTLVFSNFFTDNSFLGIIAVGMTFVILSGGIDLSVGSMIALSGMMTASLVEKAGMSPFVVIPIVLATGCVLGLFMGCLIHYFEAPAFIVTLGGMFLARGIGQLISIQSIPIYNHFFTNFISFGIPLPGGATLSSLAIVFIIVFLVGLYIAHMTKFGRSVYAIGGSIKSAELMGLPVARTRVLVYVLSGFCSSLGGIVYTMYTSGAYGQAGNGFEMTAITAVVIGGTLLTGGVGFMGGTLFGVLILGVIQTFISFEGTLSSWWTRIVIGFLLFSFIILQRIFSNIPVSSASGEGEGVKQIAD